MTQNPFEAPRAPEQHFQPSTGTGTFDLGRTINEAWAAVSRDFGLVLGVMAVGLLLFLAGYFTIIGIFFVLPALVWGGVKFLLNLQDGRGNFNDLFEGFKDYWPRTGGVLMIGLLLTLPLIPGYAVMFAGMAMDSLAPMIIGQLLIMAIVVVIMIRTYFAIFFLVDRGLPAVDAIKASWEATRDQKLNTFGLILLSQIIGSLGVLACGVGMFVSVPMSYLMFASAYRQMVGTAD
jgi:hypothetical protein